MNRAHCHYRSGVHWLFFVLPSEDKLQHGRLSVIDDFGNLVAINPGSAGFSISISEGKYD